MNAGVWEPFSEVFLYVGAIWDHVVGIQEILSLSSIVVTRGSDLESLWYPPVD